jgi:hypothetical protein
MTATPPLPLSRTFPKADKADAGGIDKMSGHWTYRRKLRLAKQSTRFQVSVCFYLRLDGACSITAGKFASRGSKKPRGELIAPGGVRCSASIERGVTRTRTKRPSSVQNHCRCERCDCPPAAAARRKNNHFFEKSAPGKPTTCRLLMFQCAKTLRFAGQRPARFRLPGVTEFNVFFANFLQGIFAGRSA